MFGNTPLSDRLVICNQRTWYTCGVAYVCGFLFPSDSKVAAFSFVFYTVAAKTLVMNFGVLKISEDILMGSEDILIKPRNFISFV